MSLPKKGEEVPLPRIKEICEHFGLHELWAKIAKYPPPQPFRSDGCTLWPDTWQGVSIYPACFRLTIKKLAMSLLGLEPAKENSFRIKENHGTNFPRETWHC